MIDIGVDESERPAQDLIVSAIVGQTSRMRKFATSWKRDLARANVDFFHAKEHWAMESSAYHGLSMTRRKALLRRLAGHVGKYVEAGISVAVNPAEYKQMTSERFRSHWGSPYTISIQLLLILISMHLNRRGRRHEEANILVEEGPHIYQALQVIDLSQKSEYGFVRIVSSGKAPKLNSPILQAADLLSYGWGEYLPTGRSEMLASVAKDRPNSFPIVPWTPRLIEDLKCGINADIGRRKLFKLRPLDRGVKPLLRHPGWDDLK